MLRLVTHIERLLLSHDCVIVPDLGGFVLQSVPAACEVGEHIFRPMRKDLLFNSTLKHQDGLLAESYMKAYRIDYSQAVERIGEDVEALRLRFNESGQVNLGTIGTFSRGNEGQYIFTPSADNLLNVSAYGLPSFYLTPLSLLKKEQEDTFTGYTERGDDRKDAIYIRINRNVLRAASVVAAVVLLVLLISTPVKDVNSTTYTASFIPAGLSVEQPLTLSEAITPAVEAGSLPAEAIAEVAPVAAPPVSKPDSLFTGKTYYAIIGSFPTVEDGMKFIRTIDKTRYPEVAYVKKGDKVRVYTDKFNNRKDAEVCINGLRETGKHKDAWLYISR